jgi:hypothetical protein
MEANKLILGESMAAEVLPAGRQKEAGFLPSATPGRH